MKLKPHWNLAALKTAFEQGQNIMKLLRDKEGFNEQEAILVSYDFQTGTYTKGMQISSQRASVVEYADALARVIAPMQPRSIMEAGIGEATTFVHVINALVANVEHPSKLKAALGFDLSWSRVLYAQNYHRNNTETASMPPQFFIGELEAIPLPDNAIDVIFTSHAIEPNHGREREILQELYRVAGKYIVLIEPAFEFASDEIRARMEQHGYCRNLAGIAREMGWKVQEHRVFDVQTTTSSLSALLIIEKSSTQEAAIPTASSEIPFACPNCASPLTFHAENYFCENEGLVFPVLRGIPCLTRSHGIVATKFLED